MKEQGPMGALYCKTIPFFSPLGMVENEMNKLGRAGTIRNF
ncbi:hypothetical protein KP78_17240 [Jeotgalibacillus soli]|uniref:Uncharacterized protein n=1 Tax=Jeotgalibacillus soli TaxID=889306 RepID=A0A0C2VHC6_9BACL|nr:hypothetical protein KP78_17240 [Jeotgalibacillus soli]